MRIFNEIGIEIESPDLEKGYLKNDSLFIMHHPAVEGAEEQGHHEVVAEYPNGGKDVKWVVDVPAVEAKEAWDEYEDILRYVAYTETELLIQEYERRRQPLSSIEALELLLAQLINAVKVDDDTALRMKHFYPEWAPGIACEIGFKMQRDDKLWRVVQAHTTQIGWEPENVPALYEQINETNSGTMIDPIPYDGNMALVNGRYYYQHGKLYHCTRDTGTPVYHPLSELIGLYVEIVE